MDKEDDFFKLSKKKSIFDKSEEIIDEDSDMTPPIESIKYKGEEEDELSKFLNKNKIIKKNEKKVQEIKKNENIIIIGDDSDNEIELDLIFQSHINNINSKSQINIENYIKNNDCNSLNIIPKHIEYKRGRRIVKRKSKESSLQSVEKKLKKLEKEFTLPEYIPNLEIDEKNENKMLLMVMVFFKGITKKYMIDNNLSLIETLTPQIIKNYIEVSKLPHHYFKFYNEENEELDFTKTSNDLKIKYADTIDCMIIHTNGNEEDYRTDLIRVKFQDGSKNPYTAIMKLDDKFYNYFENFINKNNKTWDNVKFYFDGDLLDKNQTPNDIDMDENFCIDVIFV